VTETMKPSATPEQPAAGQRKPDAFARAYGWFAAQPRIGKWVVVAAAAYAGFLVFQFVVWPTTDRLNRSADRAALLLSEAANRANELPADVTERAIAFGPNSVPGREIAEKERFSNAIAAIMKKHGLSDSYGFDARPQALPGGVLPKVASEFGGTMRRTVAEVKFTSSPDTVTAILNDIDRSPFVDAITDVRLSYKDRRVTAVLSIERWGVATTGGGS